MPTVTSESSGRAISEPFSVKILNIIDSIDPDGKYLL